MGHLRCRPWDSSVPTWALRTGFAVIVAWLCAGAVFERTAPSLAHSTGAHLTPPSGSRSERAFSLLEKYFGGQGHVGAPSRPALSSSSSSVLGPGMGKRTPLAFAAISSTVQDVSASAAVQSYEEWVSSEIRGSEFNASFGGLDVYGLFLGNGSAASKAWMLSPNKRVTLMVVYSAQKNSSGEKPFARYLLHHIANVSRIANATDGGYRVMLGGEIVLDYELDGKAVESLRRVEMLVLPVAFVILAYFLQRVQLLLVPLCCVALSLGAAFSCALPVAEMWAVSSDTPEIMVSTAVALSIDYSLFLLTRLLEGIKGGATLWQSVQDMVANTGHTITVSGGLIALAFLSALLMPISTIRSAGLLTAITAMTTVVANLTLIPAMLVCFGNVLLAPFPNPFKRFCCKPKAAKPETRDHHCVPSDEDTDDEEAELLNSSQKTVDPDESAAYKTNVWYRLADFTRRHSTAVIIVVLVLGAPIIAFLPSLKISVDRNLTRARGAGALTALWKVEQAEMEVGRLSPCAVLLVGPLDVPMSAMSPEGFQAMEWLNEQTLRTFSRYNDTGDVKPDVITGPAYFKDAGVSYEQAVAMLDDPFPSPKTQEYLDMLRINTASNGSVVRTIIYTPFRIFGPKGGPWVNSMRDVLDRFNDANYPTFEALLISVNGPDVDAANIVESHIPLIMGVICVSVMVIVGLVFRSLLLPLRLAFALAYTIAITLGVAVLVYQTEWLWWLFPYLAQYENEGLSYAVPAVVIPVCVALGLDYDIFLLTRVLEYRLAGMDDVEAVVMSVGRTGSTISGAGIIMSVAFGGLLASSETQLNQFGLLLTVSVLLDTFVIRTIFVPALMCKAASYNWWPRAM
eukprot:Rhum_TRINITY_DN14849_c0_g1::Rhum_TRINITY_DN14849_c0_g1_i2::g.119967::m.119967/K06994/K06994; putative drug exporter of the RND superfamily